MVKPTKYVDARSFACPKCGYGLVAPLREPDLLCPECGLRFPLSACPPYWSVEIGSFIRPNSLVKTLALSFLPNHIVNAVLRPRSITRPLRTLLIPIIALALLHAFLYVLSLPRAAHVVFLAIHLVVFTLNAWIAVTLAFGLAAGKRGVIGLRLWAYAVPHVALTSAIWMLVQALVMYIYDPRHPGANVDVMFFLSILGSYTALAIFFLLVGGLWWGSMAYALAAKGQE